MNYKILCKFYWYLKLFMEIQKSGSIEFHTKPSVIQISRFMINMFLCKICTFNEFILINSIIILLKYSGIGNFKIFIRFRLYIITYSSNSTYRYWYWKYSEICRFEQFMVWKLLKHTIKLIINVFYIYTFPWWQKMSDLNRNFK